MCSPIISKVYKESGGAPGGGGDFGGGDDDLDGGEGIDTLSFDGQTGGVTVNLGAGSSTSTSSGSDTIANSLLWILLIKFALALC